MRVLVVDDHEVVRRGVRSLIQSHSNYDVCGEAVDGQDAVEKAQQLNPDVIVMDVSMPRLNGLEATHLIRAALPDSEILILSQHDSPEMVRQAFKAGARGYVVKSSIARDLLAALECVGRRQPFFEREMSEQDRNTLSIPKRSCSGARHWNRLCARANSFTGQHSNWLPWELPRSVPVADFYA